MKVTLGGLAALSIAALPTLLTAQRVAANWPAHRSVTGIPVADSMATPLASPWLGGFNLPRPQLLDIDGDGDLDLFVQETRDDLIFFERVGSRWVWRSDQYADAKVGEWFRFADLDGDGDLDLLTEQPMGYIRGWRNEGSVTRPQFRAVVDTLRDIEGRPIFADPQNILNVVDIDCNGRPDLFLGRVAGYVDRYEQEATDSEGFPVFRLLAERWQDIEVLGPIPGDTAAFMGRPTMRHGANTMAFGDIDSDGDLDLFWGDFFEAGLLQFTNEGSCSQPSLHGDPVRFPVGDELITSGYNAPATGDVDGDGRLDMVMGVIGGAYQPNFTSIDNLYLVRQESVGKFALQTKRLITMIDVGSESTPVLADIDGDGDFDLLIGNKIAPAEDTTATVALLENIGSVTQPSFRERGTLSIRGTFHLSPTVADLDGDGLLDLVIGTWADRVEWWRNSGSRTQPKWLRTDSALVMITRGSNTMPALADLDGDGDLDLLVGEASGQLNYYRNIGSRTVPQFELVSDNFQDLDVGRRSTPLLVDANDDGRIDLVIGAEDGTIQLWLGQSASEPRFIRDESVVTKVDRNAAPAMADLDGDGALELILGGAGGGVRLFQSASKSP